MRSTLHVDRACILQLATVPPTVYCLHTKSMPLIHVAFPDLVYKRETSGVKQGQNAVSERSLMNGVAVVLPEMMKTWTRLQATGIERRTRTGWLIACMCKEWERWEVKEDSDVFILLNKWVSFPYNQTYRKKKRLWKMSLYSVWPFVVQGSGKYW